MKAPMWTGLSSTLDVLSSVASRTHLCLCVGSGEGQSHLQGMAQGDFPVESNMQLAQV